VIFHLNHHFPTVFPSFSPWKNGPLWPEATAMAVAESGSGGGAPQVKQVQASSSPQSVQSPERKMEKTMGIF
jgi:hypothetical protein